MPYPASNILLDSMPEDQRRNLLQHSKAVVLPLETPLYHADQRPKYIHFLTSGIASIVTTMEDGSTTEIGTVGREGAPQGVHTLGPVPVSTRCFMQVAGTALRLDFAAFEKLFDKESTLRKPILAYAQYQTALFAQVAGCNRLHPVEARLARWLLMVQDRTAEAVLNLTQEFLAQMMGSRRTTVTSVAGSLQDRGLITYSRGKVTVINRHGLQHAACECYPIALNLLRSLYKLAGQSVFDGQSSEPHPKGAARDPA